MSFLSHIASAAHSSLNTSHLKQEPRCDLRHSSRHGLLTCTEENFTVKAGCATDRCRTRPPTDRPRHKPPRESSAGRSGGLIRLRTGRRILRRCNSTAVGQKLQNG